MRRAFAVLLLLLLVLSGKLAAQDVNLSCSIMSKKNGQRFAGKSVGKRNRLWDCGVHNSTPVPVVIDDALILMALRSLDVPALNTAVLEKIVVKERYRGRLYTWSRVLDHGSNLGILGIALKLVKVDALTSGIIAAVSVVLPVLSPALRARAPSTDTFRSLLAPMPLTLDPGQAFSLSVWSAEYKGPRVVRGGLSQLLGNPVETATVQPARSVEPTRPELLERLGLDRPRQRIDMRSINTLRLIAAPLPSCSHVIRDDCRGRCKGWWSGAELVGLHQ